MVDNTDIDGLYNRIQEEIDEENNEQVLKLSQNYLAKVPDDKEV